ncbi:MAG: hypothetical protein BWY71_00711 [Planctomycetes bacterium ADurb.Bin412]|nr:MAG: hypothetical protein BWY71_00711 [Planctomycetes bacterium ADurb.Bin412]
MFCLIISCIDSPAKGAVQADSQADWLASLHNDGIVVQNELGWEYGYISNYTGMGGVYYGWHPSFFYWESGSGVQIAWPAGQPEPGQTWGEGGDSTGSRPPMSWMDGCYPWAGSEINQYAATRCWTSDYTGLCRVSGTIGRYFDRTVVTGFDVIFRVQINSGYLEEVPLYSRHIAFDDTNLHDFTIENLPLRAGDRLYFLVNAAGWNASGSWMKMAVQVESVSEMVGDATADLCVDLHDVAALAGKWGRTGCQAADGCNGADLNQDDRVDLADVVMLADHWLERPYPKGDLNRDRQVDILDLGQLGEMWLRISCFSPDWCAQADVNRNGKVEMTDLAALAASWLECSATLPCSP